MRSVSVEEDRRMFRENQKWRKEHPDPPWICFFCGEEIWLKGRTAESLAVHHRGKRQVPVHYRCHGRYHIAKNPIDYEKVGKAVAVSNKRRKGTYSTACKPGCTCNRHRKKLPVRS